ncbi:MAG: hypothetical protein FMNOHCHN_03659 [Ignavibacteriaceae bacterium]|nr:hypothetical protein [Ignavibacteriaceae bacterium]
MQVGEIVVRLVCKVVQFFRRDNDAIVLAARFFDDASINIVHVAREPCERGNNQCANDAFGNFFENHLHHRARSNRFGRDALFLTNFYTRKSIACGEIVKFALPLHRKVVNLILCANANIHNGEFVDIHISLSELVGICSVSEPRKDGRD